MASVFQVGDKVVCMSADWFGNVRCEPGDILEVTESDDGGEVFVGKFPNCPRFIAFTAKFKLAPEVPVLKAEEPKTDKVLEWIRARLANSGEIRDFNYRAALADLLRDCYGLKATTSQVVTFERVCQ